MFRRVAGRPVLACADLAAQAAGDDIPVPAQDGVRGNQQPQAPAPRFGYHGEQGRKQSAVCPVQPRAALPPLQDGELMAQDQDLRGPPRSSRWDRRSHAATRVIRRNTNRRHIIGDHHGWTAERATLLLRAVDNILGTHSFHQPRSPRCRGLFVPNPKTSEPPKVMLSSVQPAILLTPR